MGLGKTLQCSAFLAGALDSIMNIMHSLCFTSDQGSCVQSCCLAHSPQFRRQPTCCHIGMLGGKLIRRAMVVAPKTLLGQWAKELTVCGLDHSIFEYYGPSATQR